MYNHAPENYACPICLAIQGIQSDGTWIKETDIFYRDKFVVGCITSKSVAGNDHHALIVPTKHFKNLYDLPDEYGHAIFELSTKIARAIKQVRKCDGVTVLQNNEPAGDQHAFHYHLHIIPRFLNDDFHEELWKTYRSDPKDRMQYAEDLKNALRNQ